jgi:hypothetical protein
MSRENSSEGSMLLCIERPLRSASVPAVQGFDRRVESVFVSAGFEAPVFCRRGVNHSSIRASWAIASLGSTRGHTL